jgi:hypothetical protein
MIWEESKFSKRNRPTELRQDQRLGYSQLPVGEFLLLHQFHLALFCIMDLPVEWAGSLYTSSWGIARKRGFTRQ